MNLKSSRSKNRTLPTPRDERILLAIATHTFLTADLIRRLFFQRAGGLAARQTAGTRLRKLVKAGWLHAVVVDGGHGAGPFAYGLTAKGAALVGVPASHRRGRPAAPRHALDVAKFRVALELALAKEEGQLLSWLGERELRRLSRPADPVPDAFVHWQLHGREGSFAFEFDRSTESFGRLVRKLSVYAAWWRARRYRISGAGSAMKPRLVLITNKARARRLVHHIESSRMLPGTIMVAPIEVGLVEPLSPFWWRSDRGQLGVLCG